MAFDALIVFLAFDNVPRLIAGGLISPQRLLVLIACRWAWGSGVGAYWPSAAANHRDVWRDVIASLGFLVSALGLNLWVSPGLSQSQLVAPGSSYLVLVLLGKFWRRALWPRFTPAPQEELRWVLLIMLALALSAAWFAPGLVGTGDGQLYFETLQDFLNQLHAGIWPPWVSQSEVAPFGAAFPFRYATYHYYFCALLDVLTARQLTTYAVQHLSIVLSFVGGAWAMYGVLRRLCPTHPWIACAMAALYLASPAWLGPLIGFTIMALPYVPLCLAGAWPEFGAKNSAQAVGHGAALAAAWHAHPPVGFWVSVSVVVAQAAGWIVARPTAKTIARQVLAWLVCALLCSGLWYSTFSLHYGQSQAGGMNAGSLIVAIMREAFPASILPASSTAANFADIQLGYSLWLAWLAALVLAFRERRKIVVWISPTLLLVILLLPIPGITEPLWKALPVAVQSISGTWPVQRLIGPLAGAAALTGALAFGTLADQSRRGRSAVTAALLAMLIWSGAEATKYIRRSHATVVVPALSAHLAQPENRPLIGNWLAFHDHPISREYVAGKFLDARLFNRVWSQDKIRVLASNQESVTAAVAVAPSIAAVAEPLVPSIWRILPTFEFESGERYLLEITPGPQLAPGNLIVTAEQFQRSETSLSAGGPAVTLAIWATSGGHKYAEMVYLSTDSTRAATRVPDFFFYRFVRYDPSTFPIRIDRFAPYRATVNVAQPGWLETHRLFTDGYRARVNGQPVAVTISSDNRVMLPVPAGMSRVELDYVGSGLLRFTYGLMGAGWLAIGLWGLARAWRLLGRARYP